MSKCVDCLSCLDLVYFGPKRFYHCWLCDLWYDGIIPNLYKVSKEEVNKYAIPILDEKANEIISDN